MSDLKMKLFTPTQVKGDLAFVLSVAAVLGFSVPTPVSVALISGSALICVVLNAAEKLAQAHIKVGSGVSDTIAAALADFKGLLPEIQAAVSLVPGNVAKEVEVVLGKLEGSLKNTVMENLAAKQANLSP